MKKSDNVPYGEWMKVAAVKWPSLAARVERLREKYPPREARYRALNPDCENKCRYPGCKNKTGFSTGKNRYRDYCSRECAYADPMRVERQKASNRKKYGTDFPAQSKEIREKILKTNREKWGADYPMQTEKGKLLQRRTQLITLGGSPFSNPEVKEKIRKAHLARRGVENPMQDPAVREKARQSNLKKYGEEHPMQSAEVFKKATDVSRTKLKIGGRMFKATPYELLVVQQLVDAGYDPYTIETDPEEMPRIPYEWEGKSKRYFPNILVGEKRVIEVKSEFTLNQRTFERVKEKARAAKSKKLAFELWIVLTGRTKVVNDIEKYKTFASLKAKWTLGVI